jgi:hypothetical protein
MGEKGGWLWFYMLNFSHIVPTINGNEQLPHPTLIMPPEAFPVSGLFWEFGSWMSIVFKPISSPCLLYSSEIYMM